MVLNNLVLKEGDEEVQSVGLDNLGVLDILGNVQIGAYSSLCNISMEGWNCFDNGMDGIVVLDGIFETKDAEYVGLCEYSDEWGGAYYNEEGYF